MIIGITGGTGCGESSACEFFKGQGYLVIDSDKIAREVCKKSSPCLCELSEFFGLQILDNDGNLMRRELGKIVFSDSDKLKKLNEITHKYIIEEITEIIEKNKEINIVLDAPLLIETGLDSVCTTKLCILADKDIRKKRISQRDSLSAEEAKNRIMSQHDDEFYMSHCDHVVYNNGDVEALYKKLSEIFGGKNGK
jgi:dephospho-CoA kinase